MSPSWDVVVPVREWGHAKSRLRCLAPDSRAALARALAEDTVGTVRATRDVRTCWVVGSATTCSEVRSWGARTITVPDALGLRAALRSGVAAVARAGDGTAVALLVADLPMLTPEALGKALASVPYRRGAFVRDATGSGTVLLAGRRTVGIEPAFGPDSGNQHLALGAVDITSGSDAALRHDLDTQEDLEAVSPRPGSRVAACYRHYDWPASLTGPRASSAPSSPSGSSSTNESTRSSC